MSEGNVEAALPTMEPGRLAEIERWQDPWRKRIAASTAPENEYYGLLSLSCSFDHYDELMAERTRLLEALAALRSRGSSEPEEVAARERTAFNGCDAHGKPWPCGECGERRERGSTDTRLTLAMKALETISREPKGHDCRGYCRRMHGIAIEALNAIRRGDTDHMGSSDTRLTEAWDEYMVTGDLLILRDFVRDLAAARADAEQEHGEEGR